MRKNPKPTTLVIIQIAEWLKGDIESMKSVIRDYRNMLMVSQKDIADIIGSSREAIAQIERCNITSGDMFNSYYALMIGHALEYNRAYATKLVREREQFRKAKELTRLHIIESDEKSLKELKGIYNNQIEMIEVK